jgi:cyclic pyranopterin phosphate synthase
MSEERLTHLDEHGHARMVDVGAKDTRERVARARARVRMSPETARAVQRGDAPKGEVLATARIAGIQAAKQTGQLIPLAHPITLTFVDVSATVDAERGLVELISEVHAVDVGAGLRARLAAREREAQDRALDHAELLVERAAVVRQAVALADLRTAARSRRSGCSACRGTGGARPGSRGCR